MKTLARLLALVSGVTLQYVVVLVGGVLAAVAIPMSYFELFGRDRLGLALGIMNVGTFGLPIALLSFVWSFLTIRWLRLLEAKVSVWLLSGLVVGWLYWLGQFMSFVAAIPEQERFPMHQHVMGYVFPSAWAVPGTLAVWAGFEVAAYLAARLPRASLPRARP